MTTMEELERQLREGCINYGISYINEHPDHTIPVSKYLLDVFGDKAVEYMAALEDVGVKVEALKTAVRYDAGEASVKARAYLDQINKPECVTKLMNELRKL